MRCVFFLILPIATAFSAMAAPAWAGTAYTSNGTGTWSSTLTWSPTTSGVVVGDSLLIVSGANAGLYRITAVGTTTLAAASRKFCSLSSRYPHKEGAR